MTQQRQQQRQRAEEHTQRKNIFFLIFIYTSTNEHATRCGRCGTDVLVYSLAKKKEKRRKKSGGGSTFESHHGEAQTNRSDFKKVLFFNARESFFAAVMRKNVGCARNYRLACVTLPHLYSTCGNEGSVQKKKIVYFFLHMRRQTRKYRFALTLPNSLIRILNGGSVLVFFFDIVYIFPNIEHT